MSSSAVEPPGIERLRPEWKPVERYTITPGRHLLSLEEIDTTLGSLGRGDDAGPEVRSLGAFDRVADALSRAGSLAVDVSERAVGATGAAVSSVGNAAMRHVTRGESLVAAHDIVHRMIRQSEAATRLAVGADGGYVIPVVTREPTDGAIEPTDDSGFRELPVGDRLSRLHWSVGDAGRRLVGYINWFAEQVQPSADGALSELYGVDPGSIPSVPDDVLDSLRMLDDLYGVGFVDVRRIPQSVQGIIKNLGDYTQRLQGAEDVHTTLVRLQLDGFLRLEELTEEVGRHKEELTGLILEEVDLLAALEPRSDEQGPDGISYDEPLSGDELRGYRDGLEEVRCELLSLTPLAARSRAEQLRIERQLGEINNRLSSLGEVTNNTLLPDLEAFYVDMDSALGVHGKLVDAFHASLRKAVDGAGALAGDEGMTLPPASAGRLLELLPEKNPDGTHVI